MTSANPPERAELAGTRPDAGEDVAGEPRLEICTDEAAVDAAPIEDPADFEAQPIDPSEGLAAAAAPSLFARVSGAGHATGREIWRLALPIMLSQALVSAVQVIDIAMVGRLGSRQIAAVGYASQLYFMSQSSLFAVGFACVALMARAIGAGDRPRARAALAASLAVSLVTALLFAIGMLAAPLRVLALLNATPEVAEACVPYMQLQFASSLLFAVSLTIEHGLRACRDTKTPMRISLVVTIVKIALNFVLMFGLAGIPGLGIVGAGVATLLSQIVAIVLFGLVVRRQHPDSPMALGRRDIVAGGRHLREVVRLAMPSVGERIVLNLALLGYYATLSTYGTDAIAAYTIGVRVMAFSWIPSTGFGASAATLVGHALGATGTEDAENTGWLAARIALFVAIVLGIAGGAAREPLARLFTNDPATLRDLGPFMLVLAAAQPMMQVHFTLAGAFRGAGDTWTPLAAAALGNWGFRVPLAALAASFHLSLVWLWTVLVLDHVARVALLTFEFRRGAWKRRASRAGRIPLRA